MISAPVISNSSPLIGLERIGQVQVLHHLFDRVIVPPAVAHEVGTTTALPSWIEQQTLIQAIGPRILRASLGAGESETIRVGSASPAAYS